MYIPSHRLVFMCSWHKDCWLENMELSHHKSVISGEEGVMRIFCLNTTCFYCCCCSVTKSYPTLGNPLDYSPPGSLGFSRQEYKSRLPFHSPGSLPDSGIKPMSPTLAVESLPLSYPGSLTCFQQSHKNSPNSGIFFFPDNDI